MLKNKFGVHFFGSTVVLRIIARHNNIAEKSCAVTCININSADSMSVAVKGSAERTFLSSDRRPFVCRGAGGIEPDISCKLTLD